MTRDGRHTTEVTIPKECQVAGCDREGDIPKKMRNTDPGEPLYDAYVCRFHHRLFLGIRAGLAVLVVLIFLYAFFQF